MNIGDITAERPLVINNYGQLLQVFTQVMYDAGLIKEEPETGYNQELLTTKQARIVLQAKGWQVKSHKGFKSIIDEYSIAPVRKGREDWFYRAAIEAIPSRKT